MTYVPEGGIYSGNVYLDVFSSITGLLTGERDVGNTRNLTFDPPTIEKKEKIGRRMENYGQAIESIITKQTQSCKFTLDDINKENLVLSMFGESALVNIPAGSASTEHVIFHIDKWTKLAKRKVKASPAPTVVIQAAPSEWATEHAYVVGDWVEPATPNTYRYRCTTAGTSGVPEPTFGTVIGGTTSDGTVVWTCYSQTFVENTDFEIDYDKGMIKAITGKSIVEGDVLHVSYSYNVYTGFKIDANKVTAIDAQLRLIGKNVVNNDDVEVLVYKMSLKPTGGLNWITEDFATLEFTGDILAVEGSGTWKVEVLAA